MGIYFYDKANIYAESIIEAGNDKAYVIRLLEMFAKDISRDTRHKAAEMAQSLHRDIVNLNMDEL
jgi:hypothetical protein